MPNSYSSLTFRSGDNSPEGSVTGSDNEFYFQKNNTTNTYIIWYKVPTNSGLTNTGWKRVGSVAAASADTATTATTTYSPAQVNSIITELRDLKSKLRTAGILAP